MRNKPPSISHIIMDFIDFLVRMLTATFWKRRMNGFAKRTTSRIDVIGCTSILTMMMIVRNSHLSSLNHWTLQMRGGRSAFRRERDEFCTEYYQYQNRRPEAKRFHRQFSSRLDPC